MITNLPAGIGTIEQAMTFLNDLHANDEVFHPEDDATDLVGDLFTLDEGESLNALMLDIYALPGNDGKHDNSIEFCPCAYLLYLDGKDRRIVVDGDGVWTGTLGEFVEANGYVDNIDAVAEILSLETPEDVYYMPVNCGYATIFFEA